jgi:hypothetical protein
MIKVTLFCFLSSVFCLLSLSGCGPEVTAGGIGLASGFAGSETLRGIEADLAAREKELIEKYNRMVEAGEKAETLAEVKRDIERMVLLRQGAQAARDVAEIVSDGPGTAETYGAIAAIIASLGFNIFQKRKGDIMKKTTRAIVKGIEAAEQEQQPNPTNPVKVAIKQQLQAAGVYAQGDDLIRQLKIAR